MGEQRWLPGDEWGAASLRQPGRLCPREEARPAAAILRPAPAAGWSNVDSPIPPFPTLGYSYPHPSLRQRRGKSTPGASHCCRELHPPPRHPPPFAWRLQPGGGGGGGGGETSKTSTTAYAMLVMLYHPPTSLPLNRYCRSRFMAVEEKYQPPPKMHRSPGGGAGGVREGGGRGRPPRAGQGRGGGGRAREGGVGGTAPRCPPPPPSPA